MRGDWSPGASWRRFVLGNQGIFCSPFTFCANGHLRVVKAKDLYAYWAAKGGVISFAVFIVTDGVRIDRSNRHNASTASCWLSLSRDKRNPSYASRYLREVSGLPGPGIGKVVAR